MPMSNHSQLFQSEKQVSTKPLVAAPAAPAAAPAVAPAIVAAPVPPPAPLYIPYFPNGAFGNVR